MKKFLSLLPLCLLVLSACNTSVKDKDTLTPDRGTNQAAQANLNLGIEYMALGEYEKSLEKLQRARQADPDYSGTYNAMGLLYQLLERNREAENNFRKALKLNPNDSDTLNNYGRFLCQLGRSKEAEKTFLRASDNPLYATPEIAITNAGTCAFTNKRISDAEKYFRQALEINKEMPQALLQMSQLSYATSKYLSARAYLQRFLEVSRHTAASLWLGIRVEKELGDKDALASYSLSLKNNFPDSKEALELENSGINLN